MTTIIIIAVICLLIGGCISAYKHGEVHELHKIRAEFPKKFTEKEWLKLEEELD